jgi:SAM-dependent methyltransferase
MAVTNPTTQGRQVLSYPFIIWTMQRTGGTALTDLLMEMSEHPGAEHEPFNWARKKPRQFWSIAESWGNTKDAKALSRSLDEVYSQRFLIKHCYELHRMPFNIHLMEAAAKMEYRHILLLRRDESSRLISKFIAEAQGTWFKDYASKVFDEVARGQRKLGPLPVESIVAHYRHCREATESIRALLKQLGVDCVEIFYEDLYVGARDTRLARTHDLFEFLGFTPENIERNHAVIQEKIFDSGQNSRAVARFVPNLREVVDTLAAAGCKSSPDDVSEGVAIAPALSIGPNARLVREFQTLAATHNVRGPYLEVGVGPLENAILLSEYFKGEERHAIGPGESATRDGVDFHRGDPNDMRGLFRDGRFSTVLWNDALAHDRYFWRSLEEIKRVLAPGGVLIVAVADFSKSATEAGIKVVGPKGNTILNATVTHSVHPTRPDYWRISPQAMKKMILDGFDILEVREAMMPSRVFGVGLKPA